jgi:curli biogenesis system outer membrane secretion channel CsgG
MIRRRFVPVALVVATAALAPLPSHALLDKLLGSGGTKTEASNDKEQMNLGEYKGVKHAVGVDDFKNEAGWVGSWDLGRNLTTMLTSALYDSGRFVVVEREKLDSVIKEQNLAAGGRASGGANVAQTGKIRSARYIATGAVTEVEENTQGTGGGISIKGFRVGAAGGKSHITAVITLIDTTTSEVVAKEKITGKAGKRGLTVGYSGSSFGGDLGGFNKTPIGEAAQDVIVQAVALIAKKMEDYKLDGAVVKVNDDGQVLLNRGSQFNVAPGMEFEVRTLGEELVDPSSGEILGREEGKTKCTLKVTKVLEKISYGEIVSGDKPEVGDVAILKK